MRVRERKNKKEHGEKIRILGVNCLRLVTSVTIRNEFVSTRYYALFTALTKTVIECIMHSKSENPYVEMLAEILTTKGLGIYIISKHGIKVKSNLLVEKKNTSLWEPRLFWRSNPKLGCEFSFIKNISKSGDEINLLFPDLKLSFEVSFTKVFDDCVMHDDIFLPLRLLIPSNSQMELFWTVRDWCLNY